MQPLTPADCDLRDFHFMPLDVSRLLNSTFHALAGAEEWRAGVVLWVRSWHQVPAASLPADDLQLTHLAGLGRDVKSWKRIKAMALRGWEAADDGRLYHRVVAEKALDAWVAKLVQRRSSASGAAARWHAPFDPQPFDDAIIEAKRMLAALAPQSRALKRGQSSPIPRNVPGDAIGNAGRNAGGITDGISVAIPVGIPDANGVGVSVPNAKGQGQGQGQGESIHKSRPISPKEQEHGLENAPRARAREGTTIKDPNERLARFQAKVAKRLGSDGWEIVGSASDKAHPNHDRCLALCKEAVAAMGKGWPRAWA